jgi:hypothetical protein
MGRDVAPLLQPASVAVDGASAKRRSRGNGVIQNLQRVGFAGHIILVPGSDGRSPERPSILNNVTCQHKLPELAHRSLHDHANGTALLADARGV